MRCHCFEGWLSPNDNGVYECSACGDTGVKEERGDLGRFIVTRAGCEYSVTCFCWSYAEDAVPIDSWFNIHDVQHMVAYEHFQEHKRWPDGFMPEKVYAREQWQRWIDRRMAAAWQKMILKFRPKE